MSMLPDLLHDLSKGEKRLLLGLFDERLYESGEILCKEGDRGGSCFFLLDGAVQILKNVPGGRQQIIARLESGDLFGHIALIDGQCRSATCRAAGRTRVYELNRAHFDQLFESESTFAYKIQDAIASAVERQVLKASEYLTGLLVDELTDSREVDA